MRKEHKGDQDKMRKQVFKDLDTDGNGVLSEAEFDAGMDKRAERFKEHREGRGKDRQARMMAHMDANKDGKITKDELGGGFGEKMLNHLDTDGDGRISKSEAESGHGKWRKHSE
jgi:Ca2+-binding EF-hand superfamily protein